MSFTSLVKCSSLTWSPYTILRSLSQLLYWYGLLIKYFDLFCWILTKERMGKYINRPFSYCIDQTGLGAFTAKSGRKHYNPPPLTVMWMNFDSPNFPSLCSLSAIISVQTCSNKCILYALLFHKCIKIKYKTVNMYGVFLWSVQSLSRYTLIATTMFNCWVFGSANSVTRPDRYNQYNMRIVYRMNKHSKV